MLVVDTSIAVKWVVPETAAGLESDTDLALSLIPKGLLAPDFLVVEFGNALWKKVRVGEVSSTQALQAIQILPEIVTLVPGRTFVERALEIGLELNHPVYDCLFLACAEGNDVRLITADRRFANVCAQSRYAGIVSPLHEVDR